MLDKIDSVLSTLIKIAFAGILIFFIGYMIVGISNGEFSKSDVDKINVRLYENSLTPKENTIYGGLAVIDIPKRLSNIKLKYEIKGSQLFLATPDKTRIIQLNGIVIDKTIDTEIPEDTDLWRRIIIGYTFEFTFLTADDFFKKKRKEKQSVLSDYYELFNK